MDKRYQVFISSTYADLQDERRSVMQTVMELDCFPAGMELFPALDEDQWAFIRRVIDDCDYYLLIIGGRYGSLTSEGVSYTEKEYDYAVERGLRVMAFLHEKPAEIPTGKSEMDAVAQERLLAFREKVATGRLVKFWTRAQELPGLVALSLSKTIKTYPAVGWTRATDQPSVATLKELNELRKLVSQLEDELATARRSLAVSTTIPDLAPLDDNTRVRGTYYSTTQPIGNREWQVDLTWRELFAAISPALLDNPNDALARSRATSLLFALTGRGALNASVNPYDFDTVKLQLQAYGLIDLVYSKTMQGGMALFWNLTAAGHQLMLELRAIKSSSPDKAGAQQALQKAATGQRDDA